MRSGLACALLLILAVTMAGQAGAAAENADTAKAAATPAPATAPTAPGPDQGTTDLHREQDLLDRDLKHLDETTRLRIEALQKQISAQDLRIADMSLGAAQDSNAITLLAVFIAVATAVFGVTAFFSVRSQALKAVGTWLDQHGTKVLEDLKDEMQQKMDQRLGKIEPELASVLRLANVQREKLEEYVVRAGELIAERKEEEVSPGDKEEIAYAARDAKAKPDPEKMYADWFSVGIDAYLNENYLMAAEAFNHAANSKEATPAQTAMALLHKGVALGEAKRLEDAIAASDEVVRRFGDAEEPALREQVAMALVNKGVAFEKAGKLEDAIAASDEVVRRFADAEEPALREAVAKALVNRGVALARAEKLEDAIAASDEVVWRFGDAEEPALREHVAMALVNKGVTLGNAGKLEDAIAASDELVQRFGDSDEPALREQVAMALNGRAFSRLRLAKRSWRGPDREEEARALLSQALTDAEAAVDIRPDNAIMLGNKGYTLYLLGRTEEAEPVLRRALELGGEKIRDAELEDADIHPLPQDEAFKELIHRLWEEVSGNN